MRPVFFLLIVIIPGFFLLSSFYLPEEVPSASVSFTTSNPKLQRLYNEAEKKIKWNLRQFGKYKVLVEGAEYPFVWLETQPMGGYMFGKRDLEAALNNQLIFMDFQRQDGRLPGMISIEKDSLVPHYGWFQGYCFPMPAYELYFWSGKDKSYLSKLYNSLERFDDYLWKTRDSDGDGCLETWCVWDTGEDHTNRLESAPDAWPYEFAPTEKFIRNMDPKERKAQAYRQQEYDPKKKIIIPVESMDVMSYSYSGRETLALISKELANGKESLWRKKADDVKRKLREYLWIPEKYACYDRDYKNEFINILIHNNLRCMYYNSFDQEMADLFVKHHLLNPAEFWTPMPLPSIAINDPYFTNTPNNNWSGQPQGLTYQRAITALENYGHYAEVTMLGEKLLEASGKSLTFTQQFDPFTGEPNKSKDGYGPVILSVLEYISRMYGVHLTRDQIYWTALNRKETDFKYEQQLGGNKYSMNAKNGEMWGTINGKEIFRAKAGARIITNLQGEIIEVAGIDYNPVKITMKINNKQYSSEILPNTTYKLGKGTGLEVIRKVNFDAVGK